jgi:hypothetical protein
MRERSWLGVRYLQLGVTNRDRFGLGLKKKFKETKRTELNSRVNERK